MNNGRKKILRHILALTIGLMPESLLLMSCTDVVEQQMSESQSCVAITMTMNTGAVTTKTVLDGYTNLQHATRASLYIFEQAESGRAEDAKCIYVMNFDDVDWKQDLKKASSSGTVTMEQTISIPESVIYPDRSYILLGIGSDETCEFTSGDNGELQSIIFKGDNSTKTYGLLNGNLITIGKRLGDCIAQLAGDCNYEDIHKSELFAGTLSVSGQQLLKPGNKVNLYRRVAGVQGFFTNIPSNIELKDGKSYEVSSLELVYWTGQSDAVSFMVREDTSDPAHFIDYVNDNSECLIPATGSTISAENLERVSYVSIPAADFSGNGELPANGASYVLPAPAVTDTEHSTMYVLLLGKADDGNYVVLMKKKVCFINSYYSQKTRSVIPGTDGGTGIIVGQDGNEDEQTKEYCYPIVANEFYMLGTAQQPIDMGTGEQDIYLYVDPSWDGDHKFDEIIPVP